MAIGIGEALRNARRSKGATLSEAAEDTKIRETYLAALEREDFDALAMDHVYVRGNLRNYARFLGLDPEPLLQKYREQVQADVAAPSPAPQPLTRPMAPERASRTGLFLVGAVLVVVVLAVIGILNDRPEEQPLANDQVAPPPVETETDPLAQAPTTRPSAAPSEPTTAAPTEAATGGVEVTLQTTAETWMRVLVDGDHRYEGIQRAGVNEQYVADQEVELRIGNPAAVELTVNGRALGSVGDGSQPLNVICTVDDEDTCRVEA